MVDDVTAGTGEKDTWKEERKRFQQSVIESACALYYPLHAVYSETIDAPRWPPPPVEHEVESPLRSAEALYRAYKAAAVEEDVDPIVSPPMLMQPVHVLFIVLTHLHRLPLNQ